MPVKKNSRVSNLLDRRAFGNRRARKFARSLKKSETDPAEAKVQRDLHKEQAKKEAEAKVWSDLQKEQEQEKTVKAQQRGDAVSRLKHKLEERKGGGGRAPSYTYARDASSDSDPPDPPHTTHHTHKPPPYNAQMRRLSSDKHMPPVHTALMRQLSDYRRSGAIDNEQAAALKEQLRSKVSEESRHAASMIAALLGQPAGNNIYDMMLTHIHICI
jgi:hypothetical protein